jgi:fatty acid desaturase
MNQLLFFILIVYFVASLLCPYVLHRNADELINNLQKNPDYYQMAGQPSRDYFLYYLLFRRYTLIKFIIRNKALLPSLTPKAKKIYLYTIVLLSVEVIFVLTVLVYAIR